MKQRIEKLQRKLGEHGLDALLITAKSNMKYMSGFTGSTGYVLVSADKALFLTDFRYVEQASAQCENYEIVQFTAPLETLKETVERLGVKRLGFEQTDVTYALYESYRDTLGTELVPTAGIVESLRLYKDATEMTLIRKAVEIADETFTHILGFIRPGMTELDVATELEFFMRKKGASSSSFDIIVASGPRSALPHGVASDRVLQPNEFVKMDFGARYKGYVSDITRTVMLGEPTDRHKEIYDIVLEAQLKCVNGIKPGMTGKEADALARDVIAAHGYADKFGHSTGHGIGLDVHESPRLAAVSNTVLAPGMVVTVEPGIYIPGFGGVRIEDDVLITDDGVEILTRSTKEFIVLPISVTA